MLVSIISLKLQRGTESRGVAGPSVMLNKAMMGGGSPGDSTPGRKQAGFPLFIEDSLRIEEEEEEDRVSTICLVRKTELHQCLCGGRRVCVGVPVRPAAAFVSRNKPPQKPNSATERQEKKRHKSKQRTSILPLNGLRSTLPAATADGRIIKRWARLTDRSHAAQAAIHATTACLFIACGNTPTMLI